MGRKKRLKLERKEQAALAAKSATDGRRPLSLGVLIFGLLLIGSSIEHMLKLIGQKNLYFEAYSNLPAGFVTVRYVFSWFLRIAGLLSGIGIVARKAWARLLALAIGGFTVLTIYWKHNPDAVRLHTQHLDQQLGHLLRMTGTGITFTSIAPIASAVLMVNDIIFWGIFFYCFMRPSVKEQFIPRA